MQLRVVKFWQTTEKNPHRNGPNDPEYVPCDMVEYQPLRASEGGPPLHSNVSKVRQLDPDNVVLPEGAHGGEKLEYMRYVWSEIKPHYDAWKQGIEVPANGTPLAVWNSLSQEDMEAFRAVGIKTVEEVRDLSDNTGTKLRIPTWRGYRDLAGKFLESLGASAAAEREQAKDAQIAAMMEQMQQMAATINNLSNGVPNADKEQLWAELEAAAIPFDRRWGVDKLREALNGKVAA